MCSEFPYEFIIQGDNLNYAAGVIGLIAAVVIIGLYIYSFGKIEEREEKYNQGNIKKGHSKNDK